MPEVNKIPKSDMSNSTTGCCPKFDPKGWDEQTFKFDQKRFVKFHNRSFMHIPLNMSSAMANAMKQIRAADAANDEEYLLLSEESSPWKTSHYMTVTKEVPGMENVKLSGTYMSKVFEGPYKEAAKWYGKILEYVKSKDRKPVKVYFYYTTCPKCAKAYGKNYVVGFAEIED